MLTLPIVVNCPDCGSPVAVSDELLGRQVKCQKCEAIFIVERKGSAPSALAAPPVAPVLEPADPSRDQRTPPPRPARRPRPEERERPRRRPPREAVEDEYEDQPPVYDFHHPAPHRGSTIQTMGIFSILTCCVPLLGLGLGIGAISMANKDLAEIDSGRMDPTGRGQTQSGQVCGYLGCGLSLLAFVAELVMLFGKK